MFNIAAKRIPCILGYLPLNSLLEWHDKPEHTARSFFLEANQDETGWDRLYNMFSIECKMLKATLNSSEFGNQSPEMNFVMQGTFSGTLVGVIWGGVLKSRVEYINFIQRNDATKFTSMWEAKKKLQDTVTLNFARGAFQWGWRIGLFTGSYILITTSISAYRGRSSLLEYTAAGLITGACYKVNLGPKGMVAGGLVGGVFGGIAGAISLAILRLSGNTMEEVRYWQYNWKKSRDRQIEASLKKAGSPETLMELRHNSKIEDTTELIPDTKADGKVESTVENKAESKPESKTESKAGSKAESKA